MKITIDGRELDAEPGELVIAAAERSGIYVPRFCWHSRMEPVGACRMCLVDIDVPRAPMIPGTNLRRPQTSCTTPVQEGMVVSTQFTNQQIKDAQQAILELLLINHPLDCPICDRGGECPLQDQTLDYGPAESRFTEAKRRFVKPVELSPLVKLDRERCILCYRCTRFCEEISGDTMIATMQRGPRAFIYAFEGDEFDSYFSGNTVQICPVGALTSSEYRFQARPWDLNLAPTTCNLCATGCAITADVRISDGKLVRVSARVDEDVNEEWLCDKGRYGHAYVSSPERLTRPLVRTEEGLVEASWDDVFRILGEWVPKLTGDPSKAAVIVGGSLADEDAYVAQKFARVALGTNNVDSRLEGGMSEDALVPPGVSFGDLLGADLAVIVGVDLREQLPVVHLRLRVAATKRGVRVAVVHPRSVALTELSSAAHVAPLPGREAAVGYGVAARLDGSRAEGFARSAGVAEDELAGLAEALRSAARPVIVLGACDTQAVRAWRAVADAAGARLAWAPRRAGEYGALAAGAHPALLPGWRRVDDSAARAEVASAWETEPPAGAGLGVDRILGSPMELLWLVGADVLRDVPDAKLASGGLRSARFVVTQDVHRNGMDSIAHLILPAAAFAERDGTLTSWDGRRNPVRPAVDPPGAARGDYAILAEAARRLGRPIGCRSIDDARRELDGLLRPDVKAPVAGGPAPLQDEPADGLRLLTYRLLYDDGTRASQTPGLRRLTPEAFVELHPDDAPVADGELVRVVSPYGSVELRAKVSRVTRRGVAFVPYLQPGGGAQPLVSWDDRTPVVHVEPVSV